MKGFSFKINFINVNSYLTALVREKSLPETIKEK